MDINPEIYEILKQFRIEKDKGILMLLAIYFKLDVNGVCDKQTIHGINLTKIVVKNYKIPEGIVWNVPLFKGQQTEWDWLYAWNKQFNDRNPTRAASSDAVRTRMVEWFRKYPHYRKDDVIAATRNYLARVKDPQYLRNSAKFIFEGLGVSKTSELLAWCEKLPKDGKSNNNTKGTIL